jgi:hypothetical protein
VTKSEAARLNGKKGGRPRKSRAATAEVSAKADPQPSTQTTEPSREKSTAPIDNPHGLTARELLFVEHYCGDAFFVASKAYELAGYKPNRFNAARLITKEHVSQAIADRLAARVQQVRDVMDGDEAMKRLSLYARADIGLVLGPNDPIAQLPPEVRLAVKAVRPGRFGRAVEMYDAMKATELLAKAAGKLKEVVQVEDLASLIAKSMRNDEGAAA